MQSVIGTRDHRWGRVHDRDRLGVRDGVGTSVVGRPHVHNHRGVATVARAAGLGLGHRHHSLAGVSGRQLRLGGDVSAALQGQVPRKVACPIRLLGVGQRDRLLAGRGVAAGVCRRPRPDERLHAVAVVGVFSVVVGHHRSRADVGGRAVARRIGVR